MSLDDKIMELNVIIQKASDNVRGGYALSSLVESLNRAINNIIDRATQINVNLTLDADNLFERVNNDIIDYLNYTTQM